MSQTIGQTRLAYSRTWHLVNLSTDPRPLGRIATSIAMHLMGKNKPIYDPSTDCGDYVIAVGCQDLHTTGKKRYQKQYYTHNTRPGSLKQMSMDAMFKKWGGGEVLKKAVRGMLPKNRLRDKRLDRLKVFEGMSHPYSRNIVRFQGEAVVPSSSGPIIQAMEKSKIEQPPEKIGTAQADT